MTDHSFNPDTELASAALDGEITSAERAQVEGSAELRAVMNSYGALRDQIAAVAVPTRAREGALSAALATFDELSASTDNTGVVVPLHQRQQRFKRQQRWLAGAAAAAIVGVVAVASTTGQSTNDSIKPEFNAAGSVQSSSKVQPPASAARPSAIDSINGAAVVTVWATAANLATDDELVAYMTDPSNIGASTSANDAGIADVADGAGINADCLSAATDPYAAVIFKGAHGLAIRDDQTNSVRVLEPQTCAVLASVALP